MTGYEVKNKKTHYYKCQKCLGVSINAITTPKAKGKGANDLFKELLNNYQLPVNLVEAFKAQLKLTYAALNSELEQEKELEQLQVDKLEKELNTLKKRYALDPDLDKEIYLELKADYELKISELSAKIGNGLPKISNLENYISISETIVKNISNYWTLQDLETTKRVQNLVFPDGIILDTKNRVYLTTKVNAIFQQRY